MKKVKQKNNEKSKKRYKYVELKQKKQFNELLKLYNVRKVICLINDKNYLYVMLITNLMFKYQNQMFFL